MAEYVKQSTDPTEGQDKGPISVYRITDLGHEVTQEWIADFNYESDADLFLTAIG